MKILMINGSPHEKGCTYTALKEIESVLREEGVQSEILHIGGEAMHSCIGCNACKKAGRCLRYPDDIVNRTIEKVREADGFIFGSPVHYASACGAITTYLDRIFYCAGSAFRFKPGAAIVSCRRGGATAAFDQLNKYFTISQMPIVSSQYWNMVHGNTPDEVRQDLEGLQGMRTLARNMVYLIRCIEAGKAAGVPFPKQEQKISTNFIR